jgi:hypothetical protein
MRRRGLKTETERYEWSVTSAARIATQTSTILLATVSLGARCALGTVMNCWQDHADTCRNPECPFAQCGHCQVCGEDREELSEKWEAIRCACDAERRTMNLTLLKEFPMCCECKKRICKDCRVENEFIEDEIVSCEHQVNNQRQAR